MFTGRYFTKRYFTGRYFPPSRTVTITVVTISWSEPFCKDAPALAFSLAPPNFAYKHDKVVILLDKRNKPVEEYRHDDVALGFSKEKTIIETGRRDKVASSFVHGSVNVKFSGVRKCR